LEKDENLKKKMTVLLWQMWNKSIWCTA
jgi:hypothetical protein